MNDSFQERGPDIQNTSMDFQEQEQSAHVCQVQ